MSSGNKSRLLIIFVGLALVVLYSQINFSNAQSTNQQTISGFKIYENPDYNIQIQYPRSWQKSEQDLPANTIVSFSAPDTKDLSEPAILLISNFQMSNETTLDEFVDFFFKERYLKPTDYRSVSSTNTKLMDMPAREFILYDYNKDKILGTESTLKVMRVLAFDNRTGNGYSIKYATQPGLFNKYLPAAEKMIGSFNTGVGNLNVNMPVTSSNNVPSTITPPVQNMESQGPENKFILKWGSPGTENGQFHDPADLAVDSSNGFVYVADLLNNRIQKFDTEGRYLSQWGSYGSADGQFSHPGDVAVSSWGEIFVVDIDNARIEKFDSNATFVSKWGIFGTEDGQFNHPGDIAFDSANRSIFVVDTDNNRIQKFDSNGTFISKWGSLGTQDGQFNQPAGIAFDDVNKILYVADTKNDRVQKFDSNGNFVSKWGSTGIANGELKRPTGLAVDAINGVVYVADTNNQRIQKFDSSGNLITTWGSQGLGDGQFNRPSGITFDSPNTVYVSDKENNLIQVFSSPLVSANSIVASKQPVSNSISQMSSSPQIIESSNGSRSVDASKIPDTLTVTADSDDNDFPIVGTIDRNGGANIINDQMDVQDLKFEVDDWNPKFTFQFIEGSESGLVNVKQVLIGKIKAYPTSQIALTSALLWKNIPLNQEVVLKIKEKGLNFFIVQVQFTNGATGIYSGAMDVKPSVDDKSYYSSTLKDDLKANKGLKVIPSLSPKIKQDANFYQFAQNIVCDDLANFGFRSCE